MIRQYRLPVVALCVILFGTNTNRTEKAVTCHTVSRESHAGTVVPECFKDDNASQWKSGKFDPRSLRNPWTDRHQNLHGWL